MKSWRAIALVAVVAAVGALGTLLVGAATGMGGSDLANLALYILPAAAATVLAMAIARPLLARAPIRQRFLAVAVVAASIGLANLFVLSRTMFVSDHDATLVGVLLVYSIGAGVGAAVVLARTTASAVARLAETARGLGSGDLDVRTGGVEDAGPELNTLARTLDEMAEQLQRAMEREREIEAQRRDLMTAVSHDLRTPLSGLRAMVEAIDDGVVEDAPSLRRYAAEMRRSVNALVGLVDDLFELAQLDAGAVEAETERARLDEVVRSAVGAVEMEAERKGLRMSTELNGAGDTRCSPRLVRVLQNLLSNAVRHTPADGTVRIEARRDDARLLLVVVDTGEGIPDDDLNRVFEPFFRGDPARTGSGSGLGLALAKRIVEALGGEIEVESGATTGTRFAVSLPIRVGSDRGSRATRPW